MLQHAKSTRIGKVLLTLALPFLLLLSCTKEDPQEPLATLPDDPDRLVLDVGQFPFQSLSEYRFFKGDMALQRPVPGVLPFAPINTLFTDHAHKLRFVWMPRGAQATYNGDDQALDFPDGAVLIKTFYYDRFQPSDARHIIETRIMFKRNGLWEFATYVWNAEQTEATLDMNGSTIPISWIDEEGAQQAANYRIPSGVECGTCHTLGNETIPIGPKPQNLNSPHAYRDGVQNQLARWTAEGYLSSVRPKRITTVPRWDDPQVSLNDRARAYLDINCGHCHRQGGHGDYRRIRLAFSETTDPVNLGICVTPDAPFLPQHTHIVSRGSPGRSLLLYRMASTNPAEHMPQIGTSIVHPEALSLITAWIESLTPACP
ncbi:MAG: hypothetical protein KF797_02465 [Flavobacteriales bacterium]|nr:hypothetical protein [Flavobacteriales bacterium]